MPPQRQVLELEVIGFVLPYRTHSPSAAAAGAAVARLSPSATEATAPAAAAFFFHSMAKTPRVKGKEDEDSVPRHGRGVQVWP
ncbi:hypothetical protein [Nocardiopsis sp. NRRL B-16309]|uniref:hypothetical protein n=1 Tax=Nocardiopsis sp. NRRL B-16309 TaxID=1519494 RepID=UPI0012E1158B|nr:hypothetical protein [Nocardiopsis sp. NRRL B-16309]